MISLIDKMPKWYIVFVLELWEWFLKLEVILCYFCTIYLPPYLLMLTLLQINWSQGILNLSWDLKMYCSNNFWPKNKKYKNPEFFFYHLFEEHEITLILISAIKTEILYCNACNVSLNSGKLYVTKSLF